MDKKCGNCHFWHKFICHFWHRACDQEQNACEKHLEQAPAAETVTEQEKPDAKGEN